MILAAADPWATIGLGAAALAVAVVALFYHLRKLGETRKRIENLSGEMYSVLEFAQDAMTDDALVQRFRELAEYCAKLFKKPPVFATTFFRDQLQAELDKLVALARQASTGTLEIRPGSLTDYAEVLLNHARPNEDVLTTSYVKTGKFWNTPSARSYLETTRRLIQERKLSVTRIFLFEDDDARAASQAELAKHSDAGVDVRTVLTDELDAREKRDLFLLGNATNQDFRLAADYLMMDRLELVSLRVWTPPQSEVVEVATCMNHLLLSSSAYEPVNDKKPAVDASELEAVLAQDTAGTSVDGQ